MNLRGKWNMSPEDRFAARWMPEPNSGCWLWMGKLLPGGYGVMRVDGKDMTASRASWLIHHGHPGKLHVCHRCDTPPCVNPDHLFLGTAGDNVRDMYAKGRRDTRVNASPGEANGRAILTDGAVRDIRSRRTTNRGFRQEYGVSKAAVERIWAGTAWRHVP